MAGLTQYKSMRDPVEATDEPISPMDAYARSITSKGNVNPGDPRHAGLIENVRAAIQSGQISEQGVNNIAKYNPALAPILFTAYSDYLAQQKNGYSQFFRPGQPGTPDRPFTEQDVGQGVGPLQIGTPIPGTGQPAIPAKLDYENAMAAALARRDTGMVNTLQKMVKPEGEKLYGGVQYAQDPRTGQFVPYSIDPATRKAVRIEPPEGTQATVPMLPQAVMGPGGVASVVQIPSRGVPGAGGKINRDIIPNHPASMEAAGRIAMLDQANNDINDARGIVFGKDNKLNRKVLLGANVPFTSGVGEESRILYSAIENAVAGKLRAETGATAPIEEVRNISGRFKPTPMDTEKSAAYKLDRLQEFVNSARSIVDPNKLYSAERKPARSATPANSPGGSIPPGWTVRQK